MCLSLLMCKSEELLLKYTNSVNYAGRLVGKILYRIPELVALNGYVGVFLVDSFVTTCSAKVV